MAENPKLLVPSWEEIEIPHRKVVDQIYNDYRSAVINEISSGTLTSLVIVSSSRFGSNAQNFGVISFSYYKDIAAETSCPSTIVGGGTIED